MAIYDHAEQFAGRPVIEWDPQTGVLDPLGVVYRIGLSWDDAEEGLTWADQLSAFLDDPLSEHATGLVVGAWGHVPEGEASEGVVEALVAARDRLPKLTALFLGDITAEESEISWIVQTDVSPLFAAYPRLEQMRLRGGQNLRLGVLRHAALQSLIVESGGLPVQVVREVCGADLPALEHLELWLGDKGYGWDGSIEDLEPIFSGRLFPLLTYLGLRDSEIADEIAAALAHSAVLERIRVLDLSLGTLSDEGAAALLAHPATARLEKLDIHHHFCSPEMVEKLERLGITVDASDLQQTDEENGEIYRYVAVGE